MGYFPICMDLAGKTVLLVGSGPQIRGKMEKLEPFGCILRRMDTIAAEDLTDGVALVAAGDLDPAEAARISGLCRDRRIPVNVVDRPELCSFFFPALIARGNLTVSVSSGGRSPGAAGYLAGQIESLLPDRIEEILDWLGQIRSDLYDTLPKETARAWLARITRQAFAAGRPLTESEIINFD